LRHQLHKAAWPLQNESFQGGPFMKMHIYLLALTPLALGGCVVHETVPVSTTTTVTREVTTTGPVTREVVVTQAPPAIRIESQTVSPGANYVWTRGYWRWDGANYVWVSGSWIVRPRPAAVWVEGHWLRRGGRYVWVAGSWR
jgi:hypothetical protein